MLAGRVSSVWEHLNRNHQLRAGGHLSGRKPAPDPAAPQETSSGVRRDSTASLWRHPSAGRRNTSKGVVGPSYQVSI